jgi:hypothetical protein
VNSAKNERINLADYNHILQDQREKIYWTILRLFVKFPFLGEMGGGIRKRSAVFTIFY